MALHHTISSAALAIATITAGATAQSNIVEDDKFAWGENIGWLNWRDAGDTEQGVLVRPGHLRGYIWAENAGWINVGDGEAPYANTDGTKFGVNIDAGGDLFGFAWAENLGWINFDTADQLASFDQQARFDQDALRFRGYAWSENAGWINLDGAEHVVAAFGCPEDIAGDDGVVDAFDLGELLGSWGGAGGADLTGDGVVDAFDLGQMLGSWGPCF